MTAKLACLLLAFSATVLAHPGGRDANGGHVNRSTGEYHCHTEDCQEPGTVEDEVKAEDLHDDVEPQDPLTLPGSWGQAKKWARDIIYADHTVTLYCACDYAPSGASGGGVVDVASCGYDSTGAGYQNRGDVLEWEHVVPASITPAGEFPCWTEGIDGCNRAGRQCCQTHDLNAKEIIFDLHNLVPSIGQANALRSYKRYGLIDGETLELGVCDFEWTGGLVEPDDVIRGDVARIWLYMTEQHGLELEAGELAMYQQWSQDDPPQAWEFTRNDRIRELQGNGNPFVEAFPRPE